MDWSKVGALAGLGCFVMAALAVLFQVKPLPWRRRSETEDLVINAVAERRLNLALVALLILGFVVSGITSWRAWNPATFVPITKLNQATDLEPVQRVFVNETVEVDGKNFQHCVFKNAHLSFPR